jgi:hypothetical protein
MRQNVTLSRSCLRSHARVYGARAVTALAGVRAGVHAGKYKRLSWGGHVTIGCSSRLWLTELKTSATTSFWSHRYPG